MRHIIYIYLENNITEFEQEAFRQIKGTAMGPKNACAYADTAIDKLDREVLEGEWEYVPILRNIPYSTALRIYKNTSELAEYHKSKADYTDFLKARGYSIDIITEAFRKVESKPRENYIQSGTGKKSKQEDARVIPLVTDFNPGLPNIGRVLNLYKHILRLDPELCKAVNPDGIFASFRGAKTIHDKLVHSRLTTLENSTGEKKARR